jgi:hypothetical protein
MLAKAVSKALRRATPLGLTPMALSLAACGSGGSSNIQIMSSLKIKVDPRQGDAFTMMNGFASHDLNGDGLLETVISFVSYPEFPELNWIVLQPNDQNVVDVTDTLFLNSIASRHSRQWIFIDVDGDGDLDIIGGDVGMDAPPWTGGGVQIGINDNGVFTDISSQLDPTLSTVRSYAITAGDLDGDGAVEILVPDSYNALGLGNNGVILELEGEHSDLRVTAQVNPLSGDRQIFTNPSYLYAADFDGNGTLDLYVAGNWASPSHSVYFDGLLSSGRVELPETIYGHYGGYFNDFTEEGGTGADVNAVGIFDYDNDGLLDIVNISEQVIYTGDGSSFQISYGNAAFQIIHQVVSQQFEEVEQIHSSSDLGFLYFANIQNFDFNDDGLMDFVANYWEKADPVERSASSKTWGSKIFINLGEMQFKVVEPSGLPEWGAIIPVGRNSTGDVLIQVLDPKIDGVSWEFDAYLDVSYLALPVEEFSIAAIL